MRTPLSKRVRFEIFKRDLFTCQYCGSHPPGVILHVDHIVAVANDGKNDTDNLVTACQNCNLGKSDVQLSSVPQSLADKSAQVAEAEEQLLGYYKIAEKKRNRVKKDIAKVVRVFTDRFPQRFLTESAARSIKNFNEKLGLHEVIDSMEIALAKDFSQPYQTFSYFCGVCWRKIERGEG